MSFIPDGLIVYNIGSDVVFTPDPVPWDDLLNGRINLGDLEWDSPMEGYSAPSVDYPPDELLPLEQ